VKCAWSAGVYLCMFVRNFLGIELDVPAQTVAFRPYCPWKRFEWRECRLGSAKFDFEYRAAANTVTAEMVNRNAMAFRAAVAVTIPGRQKVRSCRVNGRRAGNFSTGRRFDRASIEVRGAVAPSGRLRLEVGF